MDSRNFLMDRLGENRQQDLEILTWRTSRSISEACEPHVHCFCIRVACCEITSRCQLYGTPMYELPISAFPQSCLHSSVKGPSQYGNLEDLDVQFPCGYAGLILN